MAFTYANALQFLRDYDSEDGSSRAARVYAKVLNDANRDFHTTGDWDFDRRFERLSFQGRYTTGTASVSAGGTAVTGSGTTFTAAMVGRYIRFNSENLQYRIATYVSPTSITIETYQGETALSGATFSITDERQALPARFRKLSKPVIDYILPKLFPMEQDRLQASRMVLRQENIPRYYSVEYAESSSVPTPYLWLYPAPLNKRVVLLNYFCYPSEMTVDADVFFVPSAVEGSLRDFMLAYLAREQGKDWQSMLAKAKADALQNLSAFRPMDEHHRRQEWYPEVDPTDAMMARDDYLPPSIQTSIGT